MQKTSMVSPAPPRPKAGAPALPERGSFTAAAGVTLAAALRGALPAASWNDVRRLCGSGKVTVDGAAETEPSRRLFGGEAVAWRLSAPDPRRGPPAGFRIVHEDAHLVVVEKPEGVSSVPYERKETGTAMDLVREAWRRQHRRATATPLYVVHRIDKDTSGLLCFAKTKPGERGLHRIFKQHLAERAYLAVAHGEVRPGRIESRLVPDRGDGLRGSTTRGAGAPDAQHSVTHVTVIERLPAATVCSVRLETGRTHQIRIHLAEAGHPLVGETVYVRDYERAGRALLPSPRLLLHAATLGFEHPLTGQPLRWESEPPASFAETVARLRLPR
jgi:23S rRNA pseudouridine1911/1915/1917 synthase